MLKKILIAAVRLALPRLSLPTTMVTTISRDTPAIRRGAELPLREISLVSPKSLKSKAFEGIARLAANWVANKNFCCRAFPFGLGNHAAILASHPCEPRTACRW
jgi:hypothetical protein